MTTEKSTFDLKDRRKIIHIEKDFRMGEFGGTRSRTLFSIFLIVCLIVIVILLVDEVLREAPFDLYIYYMGISLIGIIVFILVSLKVIYVTIYENGINFPPSVFSSIKKEKFISCRDIKQFSIDNLKAALVVTLQSGRVYNYGHTPYLKTDHLFPIVKETFMNWEHIEYIKVPKEKIQWNETNHVRWTFKYAMAIGLPLILITPIL